MCIVVVGDPHVTHDDIEDCRRMFQIIERTVDEWSPSHVIFLGDMHHTHSTVRAEVLSFTQEKLGNLSKKAKVVLIVGNHDMPLSCDIEHNTIWPYANVARVVDKKTYLSSLDYDDTMVFAIPYCHSEEMWNEQVGSIPSKALVFAHQSFDGFHYENGTAIKDGYQVPEHIKVISGHIHSPQKRGNVTYVGAPRWRHLGDADVEQRYLYVYDKGMLVHKEPMWKEDGSGVKRIVKITSTQENPYTKEVDIKNADITVSIEGDKNFIAEEKKRWKNKAKIKTTEITKEKAIKTVSESKGVSQSFVDYLKERLTKSQLPKSWVQRQLEELNLPMPD